MLVRARVLWLHLPVSSVPGLLCWFFVWGILFHLTSCAARLFSLLILWMESVFFLRQCEHYFISTPVCGDCGGASEWPELQLNRTCLCVRVLVWLLELSLFIYNIIWTWEKVFVLSWSDQIQYSLCIGNRQRLVLHVGVWKILCHSHLLCSLLSISKLYWTDNHGTKSTSIKSFVEFNTIDGKILDKGEAACCLSKLSHSEITATTPGSSSFSEAENHQFWKVVYN